MTGQVIGNYQVLELVGEGGMGAVYRGVDLVLKREVALKVLRPALACQPEVVRRFQTEAITNAQLNHPNIATVHSFVQDGSHHAMVMEFVHGETLSALIQRTGAMSCEVAIPSFCQILAGIEHAHSKQVIHRDIKPANIMLTPDWVIKVTDFGIARVLGASRLTREGRVVGTFEYVSPERTLGQDADERSDIYSLGILLYEMLTGHVPFYSENDYELMRMQREARARPPRELAPHIPLEVERAILRALAKKPKQRYASVAEFRACLPAYGYAAPAPVSPSPPKETRLWTAEPGYSPGVAWPPATVGGARPSRIHQALTTTFARLSWKHYFVAAALVVVATVASVLVLEAVRRSQEPTLATPLPPPPFQQVAPQPVYVPPAAHVPAPSETPIQQTSEPRAPVPPPRETRAKQDEKRVLDWEKAFLESEKRDRP